MSKRHLALNVIFSNSDYGRSQRYAHVTISLRSFDPAAEAPEYESIRWSHEHPLYDFRATAQGSPTSGGDLRWYAHRTGLGGDTDVVTIERIRETARALGALERRLSALFDADVPETRNDLASWIMRLAAAFRVDRVRLVDSQAHRETVVDWIQAFPVVAKWAQEVLERTR